MPSNKTLPIFAGIVLLMVLFVGIKSWGKKAPSELNMQALPVAPRPDADSPADTVRTLTANVAELKSQSAAIEKQNTALLAQKNDLASSLKATLTEELQKQAHTANPEVNALTAQVELLKSKLEGLTQNPPSAAPVLNNDTGLATTGTALETVQWIEPLGALPTANGISPGVSGSPLNPNGNAPVSGGTLSNLASTETKVPLVPAYTVPRNATLIGSTAMTALIGKVPFKDSISDPFPFKAIVGRDNLAANGIDMPGLDGMVFSGHTSGDWTLGCVRGNVDAVTFVFDDGTIRTLSGGSSLGGSNGQSGSANSANSMNDMLAHPATGGKQGGSGNFGSSGNIGWISDRRGIPCVSGERISNASDFLTGRIAARAAESAAKAFAQGNVTQSVTPVGGVLSAITGNAAQYAGLNAVAGGASEISDYMKERAAQSFDIVYVDTGVELAIHIDQELPIDYDPKGRKTTYEQNDHARPVAFD